jgi:hypothetical protein
MGDYQTSALCLSPIAKSISPTFWKNASSSARKCTLEGPDKLLPDIMLCQKCGHSCSRALAAPARKYEEHDFVDMETADIKRSCEPRMDPAVFRRQLVELLPMTFHLNGLKHVIADDRAALQMPHGIEPNLWNGWREALKQCRQEFRFVEAKRSTAWICKYQTADEKCNVELRISGHGANWLLFAPAPAERGRLRDVLRHSYFAEVNGDPKEDGPVEGGRDELTSYTNIYCHHECYLPLQLYLSRHFDLTLLRSYTRFTYVGLCRTP